MALLRENDVLFAYKALNLIPGLPEASRRVAGAILDHFNKKDGQCDPGIERLSRMLGLNRSTVIRATEKLDELGLIGKDSHGGKAHRASYKPNWSLFRAIVEDWDARMIKGEAPSNEAAQRGDMVSPVASGAPEMTAAKMSTGDMVTPVSDENSGSKVAGLQRSRSQRCNPNPSNKPIERTHRSGASGNAAARAATRATAERPEWA
ncbi:helix-turn-helix domain-containing protein [uncultured Martelella sp.]|uniref:helix-turn-helix domain-containing protein n=1 Tax=uncultured Martelella sp. TaxID=392331 RepID=UPI0029C87357|nr:helix-turn-helix domain-containing protein [uncultured Martelella sp.]